jgi:hypothetical protein
MNGVQKLSNPMYLLQNFVELNNLGSLPFWDVRQHRLVVSYRHFGTTYRSHLQRSSREKVHGNLLVAATSDTPYLQGNEPWYPLNK